MNWVVDAFIAVVIVLFASGLASMVETAAAHLASLVDYADLDGNVLILDDPYRGVTIKDGCLSLPERPGLGVEAVK